MSVVFMGLAGRYDNAGEIIPLGEALNVYPTCGRLETKNETVGGRPAQPEWISSLPYLSFSPGHKRWGLFVFQIPHTDRCPMRQFKRQ